MNPPLTINQAEMVLTLFKAQNADKTMGELFPKRKNYKDVLIANLKIQTTFQSVSLSDDGLIHIRYIIPDRRWRTWYDVNNASWYSFKISKFINLKDKV